MIGLRERPPIVGSHAHRGSGTTAVGSPRSVNSSASGRKSRSSLKNPGTITAQRRSGSFSIGVFAETCACRRCKPNARPARGK
eukprot:6183290-Pleurochrysis_carterae.AAC.5